jgi:hypothetical protein
MENYKKYCLCGTIFDGNVPKTHNTTKKHQNWFINNSNVIVTLKYLCICGSIITESGLKNHLETDKHKKYVGTKKTGDLIDLNIPVLQKPIIPIKSSVKPTINDPIIRTSLQPTSLSSFRSTIGPTTNLPPPILPLKKESEKEISRPSNLSYKSAPKKNEIEEKFYLDQDTLKELESYLDNSIIEEKPGQINCGCGSVIMKSGLKKHVLTKKHKEWESK